MTKVVDINKKKGVKIIDQNNEYFGTNSNPFYVNVVNNVDLSSIESDLSDIITWLQSIDENTDTVETLIGSVNTSIQNNGTLNHSDLLSILAQLQSINTNTDDVETRLNSIITNTSTVSTNLGATNESAAASDTATSGLNGLFKRLLQRITSLISLLPVSIGQKNSAGSLSVVMASDQTLSVSQTGLISTGNTTTTNLGSNAVFTGSWQDAKDYGIIYVSVSSNVASATSGFVIEFSDDGVINRGGTDSYTISANTLKEFSFNPGVRYFRVKYTNGGTATTTFFIQTILRHNGLPNSHRVNEAISDETDAQLVKSVLTAKRQDGTYGNIRSNNNDRLFTTNDSAYAEDSAHTTGETGTFILGVSNEAQTNLVSNDGDYSPIATNKSGAIFVVPGAPDATKILSASGTAAATLITVPANKIWRGTIACSGSIVGLATGNVRVVWTPGTDGTPSYTPCQADVASIATVAQQNQMTVTDIEVYAGTTSGTLALAQTNMTQFFGMVSGKLVN